MYIKDPIIEKVIKKHENRGNKGMKKFGISMNKKNKSLQKWLLDLQEELMDGTCYIEKILNKIKRK